MEQDFDRWNKQKQEINERKGPYFKEGQIWFLSIGLNVGVESRGKGCDFNRPVLVLKKFNNEMFLGIPLTTKYKDNIYVEKIRNINGKESFLIISQLRLFCNKRLKDKVGSLNYKELANLKTIIKERLF